MITGSRLTCHSEKRGPSLRGAVSLDELIIFLTEYRIIIRYSVGGGILL